MKLDVAVFPEESVAEQLTLVVPIAKSVPERGVQVVVATPSPRSDALGFVKETYAPSVVVADAVTVPWTVIEGAPLSPITTSEEVVAKFPASSVAVHTTVVVPRPKEVGVYEIETASSARSVAVEGVSVGVVDVPVASKF